jgi:hypothetical protein
VSEVALGGLIGHIMLAVEEGAPGLGQRKGLSQSDVTSDVSKAYIVFKG